MALTKIVKFRISRDVYEILKRQSSLLNMSLSEFVRTIVIFFLAYSMTEKQPVTLDELIKRFNSE